jgi:hypothetical protein
LLDNWDASRLKFVKVFPNEYKRALGEIHAKKEAAALTNRAQAATKKEATPAVGLVSNVKPAMFCYERSVPQSLIS